MVLYQSFTASQPSQRTSWRGQVSILSVSMSINCRKGVASEMSDRLPLSTISILFNDLLHKGKFYPKLKSISLLVVERWIPN